MEKKRFSIKKQLHSFKYALRGIVYLFRNEHNAQIHLFALICTVTAGFFLTISPMEWIAVIFAIGFVFVAESFNTAIEALCDEVSADYRELIRRSKDVAAAGVLIAALTAVVIGLIVFVPRIVAFFYS